MTNIMTEQNTTQSFFTKYKKWFVALIGIQLIPTILIIGGAIGVLVYTYVNDDINFHPYKSYIISGVDARHSDGTKSQVSGQIPASTIWRKYKYKTREIQKKVASERESYLSQFPKNEQGIKLAEMKLNNIKIPLQLELEKRFTSGEDFYADYVAQRIKRDNFTSNSEYQQALKSEAWKVGYAFGYREGLAGHDYTSARRSLKY